MPFPYSEVALQKQWLIQQSSYLMTDTSAYKISLAPPGSHSKQLCKIIYIEQKIDVFELMISPKPVSFYFIIKIAFFGGEKVSLHIYADVRTFHSDFLCPTSYQRDVRALGNIFISTKPQNIMYFIIVLPKNCY